jgi:hypothetical protein
VSQQAWRGKVVEGTCSPEDSRHWGSTRRRVLAVGNALDAQIEHDIASGPKLISADRVDESISVGCVSVDSAWLSFSSSAKSRKAARDRRS